MEYRTNKIFISYSSDDRDLRQIFEMRLKPYLQSTRNKFDNIWTDKQIPIGSSWNDEIQQALTESNIGILLVSPMFLGSQYSMGDELKKMLERRENGYLIVPVILRECNFTNIPELSSIQFFKTYQSEYEVTDLNRTNKLMPFDELAEVPNPNRKLLNRYFLKLANTIDYAIDNLNNRQIEAKNTPQKSKLDEPIIKTNTSNTAPENNNHSYNIKDNFNELDKEQGSYAKQKMLDYLKNNRLKEVFEQLNSLKFKEDDENMLIMIQSAWKELERDKMMGLLSHAEQSLQTNSIRSKLLQFIQGID